MSHNAVPVWLLCIFLLTSPVQFLEITKTLHQTLRTKISAFAVPSQSYSVVWSIAQSAVAAFPFVESPFLKHLMLPRNAETSQIFYVGTKSFRN